MRFKLVHKLLAANVGIIFVLTAALISLSFLISNGMFSNALNGIDREVMRQLSARLSDHYRDHRSFDALTEDRSAWADVVDKNFFNVFFSLVEKSGNNPMASFSPLTETAEGFMPQDAAAWSMPFGTFRQRCALLGPDLSPLIPAEISTEKTSRRPIRFDGITVGWLEVGKINVDVLPLANYFFKQQMQIVYASILVGGFAAALLSIFLSRQLTGPINKLIDGARQIGNRKFDASFDIRSNDELQELAESFQDLARQLAEHADRQAEWFTHISHELRAPLTILVGEIYAVCDNLSACDESTLHLIQTEADSVKRLVDDLLELSRAEEIGFSLQMKPNDIQYVIERCVRTHKRRFEECNVQVECVFRSERLVVLGDADRLTQVFSNLFDNCIRHAGSPGSLVITVSVIKGKVSVRLLDSGLGIRPEDLDRLFDRFYRQAPAAGSASRGAGLGLAICKGIIEGHRGTIVAERGSNGGLCVHIQLPTVADQTTSTS